MTVSPEAHEANQALLMMNRIVRQNGNDLTVEPSKEQEFTWRYWNMIVENFKGISFSVFTGSHMINAMFSRMIPLSLGDLVHVFLDTCKALRGQVFEPDGG